MSNAVIRDIDHLVCIVPSLEHAADGLSALGFTVTPASVIAELGLANRLVLMQPQTDGAANFLEIMQVVDAARVPKVMQPLVAAYGPRWFVLSGRSAHEAHSRFLECGLEFPPPVSVKRDWILPGGEVINVAFDVLLPIEGSIAFNYCRYLTLSHYLRQDFTTHPNSATHLASILGEATGAREAMKNWARLFGGKSYQDGSMWCASPGRVALRIAEASVSSRSAHGAPREARPGHVRLSACEIEVGSLQLVADLLRKATVNHVVATDAICVKLDTVPGLEIRFLENRLL